MAEDRVTIQINDQPVQAVKGSMLIEVADEAGITIPRFCYHRKLSVAANCRMCLVEMEKSWKPVPACATPVNEGQKFWTRSPQAKDAQQAIMEFLLINHPLDCPICDQGGECELQDVSVGFGSQQSQYAEIKRVVKDKDIGPLIETEMTRCIQCTRCVRFGDEIAGMREMGGVGRGDRLEIGTYIEKSLQSELSGNAIDLCPVGALTAKPSRYTARAWEMQSHESVAAHDSVGSNLYLHTFRQQVIRAVPRDNEAVNECWISDRDRFSYQAINSAERIEKPLVKRNGTWQAVTWQQALDEVAGILGNAQAASTAALASANATLEELYLFQQLMRGLGVRNIDHRLQQTDFSDQHDVAACSYLGMKIAELEQQDAVLLIGSNIRQEQPLLNHRLRKAALAGADIFAVNPYTFAFNYPLQQEVVSPNQMVMSLAGMAKAALQLQDAVIPEHVADLLVDIEPSDAQRQWVERLSQAEKSAVFLGNIAVQHTQFATLRALADLLSQQTGARLGYLLASANSIGAWLAGVVPHRLSAGRELKEPGLHVADVLNKPQQTYVLLNAELNDFANPAQAQQAFQQADNVIVIAPFADEAALEYATVLLPGTTFAETSGTLCNAEGRWQNFSGAIPPLGEARPSWKILRVLGNALGIKGFDWMSPAEISAELRLDLEEVEVCNNRYQGTQTLQQSAEMTEGLQRIGYVEMYASDALVRRASALQAMLPTWQVRLHPDDIAQRALQVEQPVMVTQGKYQQQLSLVADHGVPKGCAVLPAGVAENQVLGAAFGTLQIEQAG